MKPNKIPSFIYFNNALFIPFLLGGLCGERKNIFGRWFYNLKSGGTTQFYTGTLDYRNITKIKQKIGVPRSFPNRTGTYIIPVVI
jgi:hypothetical protein